MVPLAELHVNKRCIMRLPDAVVDYYNCNGRMKLREHALHMLLVGEVRLNSADSISKGIYQRCQRSVVVRSHDSTKLCNRRMFDGTRSRQS